jgi:3-oxoacyl-[acyl-carrier protein] reductase
MSDKIAVITGASRGIGKAILKDMADAGYTVVGTATSDAGAAGIREYIKELGASGDAAVLNISDDNSIADFFAWLKSSFGSLSVLVNNAGITRDNIALRMKPDQWDDVIDTNLSGTFKMCKAALKMMLKPRYGRIINMASVSGVSGNAGQSNYAAAKAAVIAMSKSMAVEMAAYGVTVNCVAPGFTATDMVNAMDDKAKTMIEQIVPMKRMATPEEIAFAVQFLASERASYITGETIQVNGGLLMQ